MKYTIGSLLNTDVAGVYIKCVIGEAKYGLHFDNSFVLDDLATQVKYIRNVNEILYVNGGKIEPGQDTGLQNCIVSSVGGYNSQSISLLQFVTATSNTMGGYLLQSTGALSPLMQQANIAYTNITTKPYDENDLMLNSLSWYTTSNGALLQP